MPAFHACSDDRINCGQNAKFLERESDHIHDKIKAYLSRDLIDY